MKAQTINDKSWKSYNNEPLRDGEILVPQLVSREYAIARGADPANLRTWVKCGVRFLVMFVPVPVAQEKICWQVFNSEVNELLDERLGPNRRSRCLIPQPDGSVKTCPKMKSGSHVPCAICPYRGVYEKEDRSVVSLDELDEDAYHPMVASPPSESVAVERFLLDDLLDYLRGINPALADVVSLGFQGFDKKDIVRMLPVKSSQAYELVKKAENLTRDFLRK